MGERKVLIPHARASEVQDAYRAERATVRRSHLQVIWLLLSGDLSTEVARVTGFTERWIGKLIDRWNADGMDGLGDRRLGNEGAKPLIDEAGMSALAAALERSPADSGLWSGRKVADWMATYLGREVPPKRGLDYLRRLGFSLQRPRPRHTKAAGPEEREAFKKNSMKRWIRRARKRPGGQSRSGPLTSTASV